MKSLLSKDEKTKLLETFRSSGQTQAAFAEVNGINPKTQARWIYQQRLEARQNQNNVEFVELKRTVVKIRKDKDRKGSCKFIREDFQQRSRA